MTNLVSQTYSHDQASCHLTEETTTLTPSDAQGRPARSCENLTANAQPFPEKGCYLVNRRAGQLSHSTIIIFRKDQLGLRSSPDNQTTGGIGHTSEEGTIRQTDIG